MSFVGEKTARSARKAKGAGHLRRGEILAAAERIFVREGYHGATIRRIADEVGVSSTALYIHFRDKSEILVEICEGVFGRLVAQTDEIAAQPIEPVQRVRQILEGYIQFGFDNTNAYQLVFASPPGALSVEKREAVDALGMRAYGRFMDVVREAAASGRLRTPGVEAAGQVLWAGAHGLVSLMITQRRFMTAEPAVLKQLTLDGLINGLFAP